MLGQSPNFVKVKVLAERVAQLPISVLIQGETGTGKEMFAHHIHQASQRPGKFVTINCAALPENLFESELFGYERGAFTGASTARSGLWQEAHTGTLFLDEVGELPLSIQSKLLRVLEDGQVFRLGSRTPETCNVRVIAATHQPLEQWIHEKRFRRDLYERISRYVLHLPPLRERGNDVILLLGHLLATHPALTGYDLTIDTRVTKMLKAMPWPGNIRELERLLIRLRVEDVHLLTPDLLQSAPAPTPQSEEAGLEALICRILAKHGPLGPAKLTSFCNAHPKAVQRALTRLVSEGLLACQGSTRTRLYSHIAG